MPLVVYSLYPWKYARKNVLISKQVEMKFSFAPRRRYALYPVKSQASMAKVILFIEPLRPSHLFLTFCWIKNIFSLSISLPSFHLQCCIHNLFTLFSFSLSLSLSSLSPPLFFSLRLSRYVPVCVIAFHISPFSTKKRNIKAATAIFVVSENAFRAKKNSGKGEKKKKKKLRGKKENKWKAIREKKILICRNEIALCFVNRRTWRTEVEKWNFALRPKSNNVMLSIVHKIACFS